MRRPARQQHQLAEQPGANLHNLDTGQDAAAPVQSDQIETDWACVLVHNVSYP
jgi:hypothetical protein